MRNILLAAGVAAASMAVAAQANATAMFNFFPGDASPGAGFTVIDKFTNTAGIVGSGFEIKVPPADGSGAPPANSVPAGTSYLSVLAGGSATITFAKPVTGVEFDWGSIDTYNTLTVYFDGTSATVVPGADGNFIGTIANGDQHAPGTNGLFELFSDDGTDTFTGITLTSSQNSFEIDNLAVQGVPEPATWAVMLMGFGGIGAMIRRRRAAAFA
jgi:hypothetical protein